MTRESLFDKEFWDTKEASFYATQVKGCPVSIKTLQTLVSRGGSPEFQKFGRRIVYKKQSIDNWLASKLSPVLTSSSDKGAQNGK
ncbi:hypothetical protein AGMMS50222_03950 [Endomicrobiia bacterium]|nr:hypothetical protein AGMMS50222_03950 [Endomicrobiia bacterium]